MYTHTMIVPINQLTISNLIIKKINKKISKSINEKHKTLNLYLK